MIEWKRLYKKPAGSLPGGVVTQWGVGAITVGVLIFLTYWILTGSGVPEQLAEVTQATTTPPRSYTDQMTARVDEETMRADTKRAAADRALRARQQQQANTAGVAAGQVTAQRSGGTCRAESRHRATLHRGRMGSPRALAPGSRRAAEPFASQFAHCTDLPQTGQRRRKRRRRAHRERSYCNRQSGRRGGAANRPRYHWDSHQRPRRSNCGGGAGGSRLYRERSGVRPPRRKRPRLFPPRLRAAPRRRTTLLRRGSRQRKTRPVGSVSMKAHF